MANTNWQPSPAAGFADTSQYVVKMSFDDGPTHFWQPQQIPIAFYFLFFQRNFEGCRMCLSGHEKTISKCWHMFMT